MLSSKNNDTEDEELVEAIKENDHDAFKILYYRYFQKLIRFAYYRLRSIETARDLIQELFFRVWTGRERLNPQKSIQAYLYRSLNNLVINYRKLSSSQTSSLTDLDERKIRTEEEQENTIDIQNAIERLPEKLKTVFILSRVEGYKYTEIAEICDISVKAVEKRMTKVFVLLRKEFG
ncbi:MAG: sigma-70 family RNA polymerase sigma factor [Ignavibacteriaceae bacterium]